MRLPKTPKKVKEVISHKFSPIHAYGNSNTESIPTSDYERETDDAIIKKEGPCHEIFNAFQMINYKIS